MKKLLSFLIRKFRCKKPVGVSHVWDLQKTDIQKNIVRVHASLIKSAKNRNGVFVSDDLVTIRNPANGSFVTCFVKGAGSHYDKMYKNCIAIDYHTKSDLGIAIEDKNVDVTLERSSRTAMQYARLYALGTPSERLVHKTFIHVIVLELLMGAYGIPLLSKVLF